MSDPVERTIELPDQEPAAEAVEHPEAEDDVASLRERVTELEEELSARAEELALKAKEAAALVERRERELHETLARLQADFENYRRRSREESAQAAARGKEGLLKALLPALDSLDRAASLSEDVGVRMVARQVHDVLAAEGVQALVPEGEAFDANLHEAIAREAREGAKPGTILAVAEKGYALAGRVVRPARVVVAEDVEEG